jgi:multidrug efflux pump subunit AcrB
MSGSMVRWAIRNTPAMNTVVLAVLVVGVLSAFMLRREVFPQFELEIILVAVPYPGASPYEVESGICQKIEEAVRSVDGIKKVTSIAAEGAGNVVIELRSDVPSVQKVLNEVQSQIDRIPSFPDLAEEPDVQQVTFRNKAITVGVIQENSEAPDAELQLREITEQVRDDLLLIHRSVLVGSSLLEIYSEDANAQFNAWLRDGNGEPYWQMVTGLARPSFMRYKIDALSHAVVRERLRLTYGDA